MARAGWSAVTTRLMFGGAFRRDYGARRGSRVISSYVVLCARAGGGKNFGNLQRPNHARVGITYCETISIFGF